jgi:FKBP-type peptidyl-prolyl cis-trans isomerase FkpA
MLKFNSFKIFRGSNLLFLGLLLSFCSFFLSGCFKDDNTDPDEEFRKQQEAYLKQLGTDTVLIKQYLQDQGITNAKRTASGLFYRELEVGQGKQPVAQKQVTVQYRLQSLEGTTLDQGVLPFTMGSRQVVSGFEEGVSLMKVGGKSQLYLPSGLAYGPGGSPPKIGPNQILIFDVELLEAKQ